MAASSSAEKRADGLADLGHEAAVFLDLPLGVAVHAQFEEVEPVFKVHLPVSLGLQREGEVEVFAAHFQRLEFQIIGRAC